MRAGRNCRVSPRPRRKVLALFDAPSGTPWSCPRSATKPSGRHPASPPTVAGLLRDQKYNLHVNVKRLTGPPHPDRDQQFRHIQEKIAEFRTEGWPILSVDSKKKELIGNFRNAGAAWCRAVPR